MKKLFITSPHGEQTLSELTAENDPHAKTGNKLFQLEAPDGSKHKPFYVCMTGEELDSLSHQWLAHRAEPTGFGQWQADAEDESWRHKLGADMNAVLRAAEIYLPKGNHAMTQLCELLDRLAHFETITFVPKE